MGRLPGHQGAFDVPLTANTTYKERAMFACSPKRFSQFLTAGYRYLPVTRNFSTSIRCGGKRN